MSESDLESQSPTGGGRIGLIAGQGELPLLVAHGARQASLTVHCLGLAGQYVPSLAEECSTFREVGLASLGAWIRQFRRWRIEQAVMVGRVAQTTKYAKWQFLRHPPDWRAIRLWYGTLRHDRRTAVLLTALANELQASGVRLIDSRTFIHDQLASAGSMTGQAVPHEVQVEIDFAWPLLAQALTLGIGQSVAVAGRDVIAVEAAEGTDAMIDRAGALCGRKRPWVLCKSSSLDHDMRADVATIGVGTVERVACHGGKAIVLGIDRVIMINKSEVLAAAKRERVLLVGMELY